MKGVPRFLLVIVVLMAIVSTVVWFSRNRVREEEKKKEGAEMVTRAERRDIESTLLLTGEVKPANMQDVKAEVGGKVKSIEVVVGQFVRRGDPLIVIDDTDLLNEKATAQTAVDGAALSVEKARGNYERAKALFEQKLISKEVFANLQSDFEIAENNLDRSKRSLQTVEDKLAKTKILAPFDGTVLDIPVTEGQVVVAAASVNAGTVLMSFADLTQLLINSHVNQVDAPRLRQGQEVLVNMTDSSDVPVRGHIDTIAPLAVVKNNIKGFEVEAAIDDNDGRLKPGMSVSMNVPVGKADSAVSVPVSAIFKDSKQNVVYVRKGETTEKRKVTVGVNNLSFIEIKSGVNEGEEILLVEPAHAPTKS